MLLFIELMNNAESIKKTISKHQEWIDCHLTQLTLWRRVDDKLGGLNRDDPEDELYNWSIKHVFHCAYDQIV